MEPRAGEIRYLLAGAFRRMAYVEWGDPAAEDVLVCVHGLTRTGRDFDILAQALADRFRVVCPDLPGRGASQWLDDPVLYDPSAYVQALSHLLAAIGKPVSWVGTSLGGICGMAIAAAPGQPIIRMVLNDIGGFIPEAALRRIGDYVGIKMEFADLGALESHLRVVNVDFGALSDAHWAHLARTSARALPDGRVALHYDPAVAASFRATPPADIELWHFWEAVDIPVLLVRGERSDLLDALTFARMCETGAAGLVVEEAGHAPALMDAPSIAAIRDFLLAPG